MEEQSSICVQKKTILALTMIIMVMMIYLSKDKIKTTETYIPIANLNFNEMEECSEIIISENKKFAAGEVVNMISGENAIESNTNENNKDVSDGKKVEVNNIVDTSGEKNIKETKEIKNVSHETSRKSIAPTEYESVVSASSTAYCLCTKCCGKSAESIGYGVTASGFKIVPGAGAKVIAVDPNVIPLGSKVYVENASGCWNYGYAIAADTGGAINGTKIDLYMDTHEEALSWGRKNVKVYIIE